MTQFELNTALNKFFDQALEEFIRELVGDRFNQNMMDSFPNKDELVNRCSATFKEAGVLTFKAEQFFNEARSDECRSAFKGLLKKWAEECVRRN